MPPYMSLLARSVATLEGIALTADPNYQMVAQAGGSEIFPRLVVALHLQLQL